MKLEESYLRARALPQHRQQFLDEVELGEYSRYVSKARYATKGSVLEIALKETGGMANYQWNPLGLFFKGIKSLIAVDERPFLILDNVSDFMNILLYHEGEHARQRFENPRSLTKQKELMEALAWQNQLKNLDPRCSYWYKEAVCSKAIELVINVHNRQI